MAADSRTAIAFSLAPGNAHDAPEGRELLSRLGPARLTAWGYDRAMYRRRDEIERLFRRLKGLRRIFSRFKKLDVMFPAFTHFALIVECLRYPLV